MANVSQAAPPLYALTDSNHAALVVVTAIVFFIYAILGIVGLLVSALLYFTQTACVIAACNHGLGEHRDTVSEDNFVHFSKLIYASRILAILVHATTKISLGLLIRQIKSQGGLHHANMMLGGVVIAWAVSGVFASAFACPMPKPWFADNNVQCPAQGPIFMYNGIMIILSDVVLCLLPVAMMWEVQTSIRRKLIVISLFGVRLLVPIITIPELIHASYMFGGSDDVTWRAVSTMIWGQIALGLSVLTVCVPSLKGVIDSLLGSTAVAALNTPYDLKYSDNGTGLEMTAFSDSRSRRTSKQGSGLNSGLRKSSKVRQSHQPMWRHDVTSEVRTEIGSGSDSVRNLTEGVMVNTDFEVSYDDKHASRADSMGSTEGAYRMQGS